MSECNLSGWRLSNDKKLKDNNFVNQFENCKDDDYQSLDITANLFTKLPNITNIKQLRNVKVIRISGNEIENLTTSEIPDSVELFDADSCWIKTTQSFDHLLKLKKLFLNYNRIEVLEGLPPGLIKLELNENYIHTLKKNCFPNESVYSLVLNALQNTQQLEKIKYPPPSTIRNGYKALQRFFKEEDLGDQIRNSNKRLFFLGLPRSGKTSLIESLLNADDIKTRVSGETHDIYTWKITSEDIYYVYDQKLNNEEICTLTNALLLSASSIVLLHYDISSESEARRQKFVSALQTILQQQPNVTIHCILTCTDRLHETNLKQRGDSFQDYVLGFIRAERKAIETWNNKTGCTDNEIEGLLRSYDNLLKSVTFSKVSNKNYSGIDLLSDDLKKYAAKNREIPEKWNLFFCAMSETPRKVWNIDHIKEIHRKIYGKIERFFNGSERTMQMNDCLGYLHETGLVIWQQDHEILQSYVFHQIEAIICIFRRLFQEDLCQTLNHANGCSVNFDDSKHTNLIRRHKKDGLLNKDLLDFLWSSYNLNSEDKQALLELMKAYKLCYQITASRDACNDYWFFFPWYVKDQKTPDCLDVHDPMIVNDKTVSLLMECQFYGKIPANLCQMLCVELLRYAVRCHYNGEMKAWSNGLMVTLDRTECFVYTLPYTEPPCTTIFCCVRSPVEDILKSWDSLGYLHTNLSELLTRWKGIVKSIHLRCAHCKFKRMKMEKLHSWPIELVWPRGCVSNNTEKYVRCCKEDGESVPSALILPLCQDQVADNTDRVAALEKYLQNNLNGPGIEEQLKPALKDCLRGHRDPIVTVLYPDHVIDELFQHGHIKQEQKEELNTLSEFHQAEYLLNNVLLRGSMQILNTFHNALVQKPEYHRNISIAKLIPVNSLTNNVMLQEFLQIQEIQTIKGQFYKSFKADACVEDLKLQLFQSNCIDDHHMSVIDGKSSENHRRIYLLDNVLLRGTYTTVELFWRGLVNIEQWHIARHLPLRR